MTARARERLAAAAGVALIALHAALLPVMLRRFSVAPLRIAIHAPGAEWPEALRGRVRVDASGGSPGPGMARTEWSVTYRGGFEERAGTTRLVGPFQDPAAPRCALRVILGQSFLERDGEIERDGETAPGTLAAYVAGMMARELRGTSQWPLGDFVRVHAPRMRWLALDDLDERRRADIVRAAGDGMPVPGVVRVTMELRFEDGSVPLWVAVVPRIIDGALVLRSHVEAELVLGSSLYQLIADLFDGSERASKLIRRELDTALARILAVPPAIALGGGQPLRVGYCATEPIEIVTGQYAAVPMHLQRAPGASVEPVLLGPSTRAHARSLDAPLAVELELDALNGILHELWRTGVLDRALADARLGQRFNEHPLVAELLSVRIGELALPLPPTLWHEPGAGLRLGVETALRIRDRTITVPARIFGRVSIAFRDSAEPGVAADVSLEHLLLTCEPQPGTLAPCYADLVRTARDRAGDVHDILSAELTRLVHGLTAGRRVDAGSAHVAIDRARVDDATPGLVRVELYGALVAAP